MIDDALSCAYVALLNSPPLFRVQPATQKALCLLRDAIAERERIDSEFVQDTMEKLARAMSHCWKGLQP
jgi:hypothetical protein